MALGQECQVPCMWVLLVCFCGQGRENWGFCRRFYLLSCVISQGSICYRWHLCRTVGHILRTGNGDKRTRQEPERMMLST